MVHLLKLRIFVESVPPQGDDARTVRAVEAAAGRFPDQVDIEVLSIGGPQAAALGLTATPVVLEGETVLSVGTQVSAGRLKRYIEAELASR